MLSIRRKKRQSELSPIEADLAPRGRGVARLHRQPIWNAAGRLNELPRWTGTAAALGFLTLTISYGIVLGGYSREVSDALLSASGLGIEAVKLSGQRETDDFQILEALEIEQGDSLALYNAEAARERLTNLAWVKTASVMKLYPGTLKISIEERVPYALWQRGDVVSIINQNGDVITDDVDGRYANLLLVVNHGAQRRAGEIMDALDKFPELRPRVRAAFLVSQRRWDILLENDISVRLPEDNIVSALADLVEMDAENGLLTRDIVAVDMRLSDRVVVRLTEEAAERRRETTGNGERLVKMGRRT
ncbi:cell division protein FtsQ [Roseibium hamelinense]|uniref:Cell division protein FtsQ n=1 Tax=Roseibium hamelinense TaxID=150831 RepID=A0A562TAL4_9HYPH|nr:cell division protein FtsQ/DivIB [Roseibium hamelinense]MTI45424.1 FtsQ-type POTRA domain-containing protein [Roseibium hamelinense]TWI90204.1 cell division protein FtsQ [Roseibium hamelinense]